MNMREKLEQIIDSSPHGTERRATAMNALTHLASYQAQVPKFTDADVSWFLRRTQMEARFVELIRELEIVLLPTPGPSRAFDMTPAR
jgi:hypothetical protein